MKGGTLESKPLPEPDKGLHHARARSQDIILGAVCALVIGIYIWSAGPGILESTGVRAQDSYYNLLVEGFRAGHLSVNRPAPPGLAQLANPYDPAINARYIWEKGYMSYEMSYYHGKLYLYFGVTPALVLFWPYATLTGHYLATVDAVVIFLSGGFLVAAGLLRAMWRRYFPEISVWIVACGLLALGLGMGILETLSTCDVYEVARSCGFLFAMLALAALWRALHEPERQVKWLVLASLSYGLAVGARPALLYGAIVLLVPVIKTWCESSGQGLWKTKISSLLAAVMPIALVGMGIALYNYLRFDNPLEFGWHYQLTSYEDSTIRQFSVHYVWYNFRFYFLQPMAWDSQFPYLKTILMTNTPPGHQGIAVTYSGLMLDYPIVWLALAVPLAWKNRKTTLSNLRWFTFVLLLLFAACGVTICLFFVGSSRYQFDFLPGLMLLTVIGILSVERALVHSPSRLRLARAGWCLLLAYSILFNVLAAIDAHASADYLSGNYVLHQDQYDEAIAYYRKALVLKPQYPEALGGLGGALFKEGRIDEAIVELNKALVLKPNDSDAHNNLAFCYLQKGQWGDAITQFQKAIELNPNSAGLHNALANAYFQKGDTSQAIAEYHQALAMDPGFVEAYDNLGYCLFQAGHVKDAIAQYQKSVKLQPDLANSRNALASALAMDGQTSEAILQYQKALEITPDFPEASYNLAYCLGQVGRWGDAITQYETAIKYKPDFVEAYNSLAWILATSPDSSLRDGKEAVALAEKANELSHDNDVRVLRTLAAAYAEAARFPEAISAASRALALDQSDASLANELKTEIGSYEKGSPWRSKN
jgi:tetratricopeptide (TPR) repeat protein